MSSGRTKKTPLPSSTNITTTEIRGTGTWDSIRTGHPRTGGIPRTTAGHTTIPGITDTAGITVMVEGGTIRTTGDTTGGTAIPTAPTTPGIILPSP
jgi:hypothetical protein